MKIPSSTPTLEEILSRLPLDEKHLNQLALQENGEEKAADHGRQVFETQYGDEIQTAGKARDAKASDLTRLEDDLNAAKEHRETLEKKLSISPEEAAKHPMSSTTIMVQVFLAGMVLFLLGLGAHNFATLLIKTGEPFLTRPWMAYATAFTAATLIAVVLECFINLPKRDETKRLLAAISLSVGIVCGIAYLAVLSQVVPPDFGEPVISSIIPPLGGVPSTHDTVEVAGGVWRTWLLFFQFVAEATGASGLAYFFVRNLKIHRAACLRDNPDYKDAIDDVNNKATAVRDAKNEIGGLEGFLRVMTEAREMIIQKARAHVAATSRAIRMVLNLSGIKPVS